MAYIKPPVLTRRLANPMAMRLGRRGVATLTVAGRRTGEPHKVPVIPVEVGGSRYLVAPLVVVVMDGATYGWNGVSELVPVLVVIALAVVHVVEVDEECPAAGADQGVDLGISVQQPLHLRSPRANHNWAGRQARWLIRGSSGCLLAHREWGVDRRAGRHGGGQRRPPPGPPVRERPPAEGPGCRARRS